MLRTKKIAVGLFSGLLLMWVGILVSPPSSFAVTMETTDSLELSPSQQKTREGVIALRKQDYTTAEAAFQKSIKLDPQNVKALLGLARSEEHTSELQSH